MKKLILSFALLAAFAVGVLTLSSEKAQAGVPTWFLGYADTEAQCQQAAAPNGYVWDVSTGRCWAWNYN